MKTPYCVLWYHRLGRFVMISIFRLIMKLLARVKVTGVDNIPKDGAYMVVFNHVSIYDPPVVGAYLPRKPEVLGAVDIWSRPGQNILARIYGGIPIRRGEVDRSAMERCLQALRSGFPLLLAPEGGRSHEPGLRTAKPGIVYLVDQTHVPIVPIGVTGTTDDFFKRAIRGERPRVQIVIGNPFVLPDLNVEDLAPKEVRQMKADYIMMQIAALLPPDYRGVYANPSAARSFQIEQVIN